MGTNDTLLTWIESKPGPFTARTPDSVWDAAWANFNEGPTGQIDGQLIFMLRLGEVGIDVRPTGLGGYVLDSKP